MICGYIRCTNNFSYQTEYTPADFIMVVEIDKIHPFIERSIQFQNDLN